LIKSNRNRRSSEPGSLSNDKRLLSSKAKKTFGEPALNILLQQLCHTFGKGARQHYYILPRDEHALKMYEPKEWHYTRYKACVADDDTRWPWPAFISFTKYEIRTYLHNIKHILL